MEDWLLIKALGGEAAFTPADGLDYAISNKKRIKRIDMMVWKCSPLDKIREPLNEGERIVFSNAVYAHGASER